MNQHLKKIVDFIQQSENLSADEKADLLKSTKDVDKEIEITAFKLDRTEKVKRTTAILLEETIEELEQKRKSVEDQNRELEIESSLERVRTVAMGMKKPDDMLDVCRMISDQLQQLGFKEIRNVQTVVIYEQRHEYVDYQYFTPYDKNAIEVIDYRLHPDVLEFADQMLQSPDAYYTKTFEGEALNVWREYRKQTNQLPDPKLDEASSSHYYFYSIGSGALGITTYAPLSEQQINLFKRFRNVFQLAYRRFIDIEKATAQAREAMIEASLEKVRAQALGMKSPGDLLNIVEVLFSELKMLGFTELRNTMIQIYNDDAKSFVEYEFSYTVGPVINTIAYNDHPVTENLLRQIRSSNDAFGQMVIKGDELKEWRKHLLKAGEKDDPRLDSVDSLSYYFYSIEFGSIGISTYSPIKEEKRNLLRRFRNVFDFAYRRFQDVAQAEAQAREAQIELALERIRARTMAMQKSDELKEVIQVVYDQFVHLDILTEHTGFIIDYKARDDMHIWLADQHAVPAEVTIPYFDCAHWNSFNEAKEKGKEFFTNHLSFEEKNKFYQDLFNLIPGVPDETKEYYMSCPGLAISTVLLENVGLYIENFSGIPYTDEENSTLMRFGKVFQQTYTRFLDLQKAEAQAREAQIEASLERVRSKTMGMHKSGEVMDVAGSLFEELQKLGFAFGASSIIIMDKESGDAEYWMAGFSKEKFPESYHVKYFQHPYHDALLTAWKTGSKYLLYTLGGEEKKAYDEVLFTQTGYKHIPEEEKKMMRGIESVTFSIAFIKHGALHWGPSPLNEEQTSILQRFAHVFEQSYTRFLDLQKAEAQAREALIEAALERTRTHSMLMQHSSELDITSRVFHEQLLMLGIDSGFSYVWLPDVEKDKHLFWATWNEEENGSNVIKSKSASYDLDRTEPYTAECFVAWASGEPVHTYRVEPAEVKNYFDIWKEIMGDAKKQKPEFYPGGLYYIEAFMKYGCFGINIRRQLTDDEKKILYRFTIEFERTYTRFLDLKKSEAQSREAQIELGLERVRARAMAMQKSDELSQLVDTVFKELTKLDFALTWCIINIIDEGSLTNTVWAANPDIDKPPDVYHMKFEDYPFHHAMMKGWKERNTKCVYELEGLEKKIYDEYLFNETEFKKVPEAAQAASRAMDKYVVTFSFSNFGGLQTVGDVPLSDANIDILSRFGKVFDLTYTRFNDLLKAEAQSREAQIELALERVRARTMAMQKSEELPETSFLLFQQFKELGATADQLSIGIFNEEKGIAHFSATIHGNQQVERIVHLDEPHVMQKVVTAWKANEKSIVVEIRGESLKQYNKYRNKIAGYELYPENIGPEDRWIINVAFFSKGWMSFSGTEPVVSETLQLLERFAGVFDLTYTRFLDLKNAEAQAREANIEAGLERVRSRAMSMQNSGELADLVSTIFTQLTRLDFSIIGCFIWINNPESATEELWLASSELNKPPEPYFLKPFHHPYFKSIIHAWKQKSQQWVFEMKGEEKTIFQEKLFAELDRLPPEFIDTLKVPDRVVFSASFSNFGALEIMGTESLSDEKFDILHRFGKVFDLSYTRFNDLQKAEAQVREAQIEASLERVRSRTMAMHKSEELSETSAVLFHELQRLGIHTNRSGFGIYDESQQAIQVWLTATSGEESDKSVLGSIPIKSHPAINENYLAWKANQLMLIHEFTGGEVKDYYDKIGSFMSLSPQEKYPGRLVFSAFFFSEGSLNVISDEPLSEDENGIMLRFTNVFGQTYRRYLDLQKAEAQAREAQIEAALEKVRSRSLAMHRSDELEEVIIVVSEQLQQLQFRFHHVSFGINDEQQDFTFWTASPGISHPFFGVVPFIDNPIITRPLEARKNGIDFIADIISPEENQRWLQHVVKHSVFKNLAKENMDFLLETKSFARSQAINKHIILTIGNYAGIPYTDEQNATIKRFGNVFEQAYTRFLDLQKAEAQAREAQIEASLERVRSKAMSMQKSEDLANAVAIVFEELGKLNLGMLRCGIGILNKEKRCAEVWTTTISDNDTVVQVSGDESMDIHPLLQGAFEAWVNGEVDHSYVLKGEDLNNYYKALIGEDFRLPDSQSLVAGTEGLVQYYYNATFSSGGLFAFRETEFPEEAKLVLRRFADVFNLTYTRFNDLKQAEAQAREAKIETSLERVRAHAMAMHDSADLSSTVNIFFKELKSLGITPMRCGVGEMHEETKTSDLVFTTADKQGELYELPGKLKHEGHPVVENIYNYWKLQEEYHPVLQGADINAYYRVIKSQMELPDFPDYTIHYGNYFYFREGFFFAWAEKEFTKEAMNILRRFTSVLSLTYRRYKDLKEAEAQAREAKIETALERVRSRTLAMQKSDELAETAAVLFRQLINLGIEPNRLYLGIIPDDNGKVEFWVTDEDGSKVSTQFSGNTNRNATIHKMYVGWKEQLKSLTIDMHGKELQDYLHYLNDELKIPFKGGLQQKRRIQTIAYFSRGFIGIASPDEQPGETTALLERFAAVFNLTYTRFKDLKVAEAHAIQAEEDLVKLQTEKKRAEDALTELRSTQTQLIQSEKMASLGELTAGIAHEIQNPLNFVNNFSEVSNELISEMVDEVEKGNTKEAKIIAKDVQQNLEKILHHGRRADEIVKGMLQHSRSSSSTKELTDINKLADEYVRLAYHGLRAKDKTFNATFKTELDETIGTINIIPQDIGRVILNLINNAFYAVTEKKKKTGDSPEANYEPTVIVSTKKAGNKVEVIVKDNGKGIPPKVFDKIFQPFFTTKPTGQGTGLGLSLSYDIVKAHGGELKVNTKENEGTEFTIVLDS